MHFASTNVRWPRAARLSLAAAATLLLLVAVPASEAAVISAANGTATFVAKSGETNVVEVTNYFNSEDDFGIVVSDEGATLTAAAGCTAVSGGVACPVISLLEIHLGNKDDQVHLTDPIISYVAVVFGGSGNDHIAAANDMGGEYHGQSGDDVITGSFNGGGAGSTFTGGTGDDTISVRGTQAVSVYGDNGDDTLVGGPGRGAPSFMFGGRGDDRLEAIDTPWFLDGGPGDDILIGGIPQ
jgi:Ca2+-binding RTX toxin-like protein